MTFVSTINPDATAITAWVVAATARTTSETTRALMPSRLDVSALSRLSSKS